MAYRRERFRISGGQTSLVVSPMAGSSAARSPDGRTSWSATREWAPAGRTTSALGGADPSVLRGYGRSNVDDTPGFLLGTASPGAGPLTSSPDLTGFASIRGGPVREVVRR